MTKITDPSGNTTYVYDALGRVTSKTQTVTASPAKTFTVGYGFSNGRQTGITYPSDRAVTISPSAVCVLQRQWPRRGLCVFTVSGELCVYRCSPMIFGAPTYFRG
jgi:hypothetical protein